MTDGSPNHAYKVGHAAGRAAGIRAAMSAIASLPTGKSEDVMEGQEQAYRAIEDLLLSLADGPSALPAVTPAVKVKPLVWSGADHFASAHVPRLGISYSMLRQNGLFHVSVLSTLHASLVASDCPDQPAAKAAAQADYEARILSALDVTPAHAPHEYQPSLNPNDQGECVICGSGPHTRIDPKPVTPTLAAALALPEVKALVGAVRNEITARQLYENAQTDRGAAHGPKGQAFAAWQRAIAEVFAALRRIAEGGE